MLLPRVTVRILSVRNRDDSSASLCVSGWGEIQLIRSDTIREIAAASTTRKVPLSHLSGTPTIYNPGLTTLPPPSSPLAAAILHVRLCGTLPPTLLKSSQPLRSLSSGLFDLGTQTLQLKPTSRSLMSSSNSSYKFSVLTIRC